MIKKIIILLFSLIFVSCDGDNEDTSCNENSTDLLFSLNDLNPESNTFQMNISPETYSNTVRLFYFSNNEN
tara:strand:+ start:57 stop:269 length:213 start_codon:yes stop_codon:yes gene_type:complete